MPNAATAAAKRKSSVVLAEGDVRVRHRVHDLRAGVAVRHLVAKLDEHEVLAVLGLHRQLALLEREGLVVSTNRARERRPGRDDLVERGDGVPGRRSSPASFVSSVKSRSSRMRLA